MAYVEFVVVGEGEEVFLDVADLEVEVFRGFCAAD